MKVTDFYKNAVKKVEAQWGPPEPTDEEIGAGEFAGSTGEEPVDDDLAERAEEIATEAFYQIMDLYGPENLNEAMEVARKVFLSLGNPQ